MLGLIANLENRRAEFFRSAVADAGLPEPACVAWSEILQDPACLERLRDCSRVRIDSCGENAAVIDALIHRGGGPEKSQLQFGEIGFMAEAHRGFCSVLDEIASFDLPLTNTPADIQVMFDKWASHQRFEAGHVPRPATRFLNGTVAAFRQMMMAEGLHRVFLKPLHGSSASGVCAYRCKVSNEGELEREQLIAPIELQDRAGEVRLFNSLRIRSYTDPHDIERILERLLPHGMVCETWLRKAWLDEKAFDLRIVTIAGEARHLVVRQSRHAMTNLHLGNERGDVQSLHNTFGDDTVAACGQVAEQAAACFSDSLVTGVDVTLTQRREIFVLEINAFGDLLPGIEDRGQSTYDACVAAMR